LQNPQLLKNSKIMNSNDIFIFKIKNEINFYDIKVNLKINNNYITRQLLLYDKN